MTAGILNGPGDVRGGGTIVSVAHDSKSSVINAPMSTGNGPITFNVADGAVPIDLSVTGNIVGGNGLTKSGLGTLVLSGTANIYAGNTTVTAGTLSIGSAYLADAADVLITTGATLDLTTDTTDTIDELKLDGAAQKAGVYGVIGSGAQFEVSYITGTGTLTVTTGPAGYAGWAATNAPGQSAGQDYDYDGVSNGVEWVLGGTKDTNDLDKLPQVSTTGGNLVFTFLRDQNSETPDTALRIQVGTNLVDWTDNYAVPNDPVANNPGVTVADHGGGFDIITLTIPQALDAKKFARLNVTISP
jgi:autotransporter-associated beta strand protein